MNIFAIFHDRVTAILAGIIAEERLPADLDLSRFVVEPPRDLAHGDLAVNAAMVYAKEAKASFSNPRQLAVEIAAALAGDAGVAQAEVAGPGFINVRLTHDVYAVLLRAALIDPKGVRARRAPEGGRCDERRICFRQSDGTDACRLWARRGVRGCAGDLADVRGAPRRQGILHQRRWRAGRCLGAFRLPAISRGARCRHRCHPGRSLSRRLPQARGCGAGGRAWRGARGFARNRVAAAGAGHCHRCDDEPDPRGSRGAEPSITICFIPNDRCNTGRMATPSMPPSPSCAPKVSSTRGACRHRKARSARTGRTGSKLCFDRAPSATTSIARCSNPMAAILILPAISPTTRSRWTVAPAN